MASSIGGLGFASFIHAESEVALFTPGRAPAVSSNDELLAPAILETTGSGLSISNKRHLMINMVFSATAAQVFLSQDAALVVTESVSDDNASCDGLFRNEVHQLIVRNVPALDKVTVLENGLGLVELAGSALHT